MKKENIPSELEKTYWKYLTFLIVFLLIMIIYLGFQNFTVFAESPKEETKFFCGVSSSQNTGSISLGKSLFKTNCGFCHNKNMKADMTGPALGGVQERWENEKLLYQFIRNSQSVINSRYSYAVNLYKEYDESVMTSFPDLTDEEIQAILDYINEIYAFSTTIS